MAPTAIDTTPESDKSSNLVRNRPHQLAHVVLRTTTANYQPLTQFYVDVLGAHIVHTDPVLTFLRYDEEHHRIAIIQTPDTVPRPKDASFAGMDHIAFTYSTLTQLAQQYTYLKSIGKHPIWAVNHGPTTSLYYRDPDGNKIELQVDNFDKPEHADDFMSGPLYEQNPMGTDFDPDEWASEILGNAKPDGEEGLTQDRIKELKMRKEIGERHDLPAGF